MSAEDGDRRRVFQSLGVGILFPAGLGKCNVFAAGIFSDVRRYARLTQRNQRTHMLHFSHVAFLGGSIFVGFHVAGFRVILGGGLGPPSDRIV